MISHDSLVHQDIVGRFSALQEKGRLAHAYLFVGPKDTGKAETARAIADSLCDEIDIHMIECDYGETIKIDQVRELLSQSRLKPFSSERKVFIVRNIECLTPEGSNALLKTLEEPSNNSLFFLTTSVPHKVLGTVRSRCQSVYFPMPSSEELAEQLRETFQEDAETAHFLGHYAYGCLGTARRLKEDGFYEHKNEIIDQFLHTGDAEAYIKKLAADKEKTKECLDLLLSWVRDAILIQCGVEDDRLIHLDRIDDLKRFQRQYSFQELMDTYNEIVRTCKMLADNLNVKMPLLIIKEKLWVK